MVRRNIHNAGVSLSGEGLDKALSGKVANEFIESALGMGFSTAYETCWTPQGSLVQVLVMSHSQRVAFFQRLADIRRAETIRGMLNDSMNKMVNYPDRSEIIDQISAELVELDKQVINLEAASDQMVSLLSQFTDAVEKAHGILALPTRTQYEEAVQKALNTLDMTKKNRDIFLESNQITPVAAVEKPSDELMLTRERYYLREALLKEIEKCDEALTPLEAKVQERVELIIEPLELREQRTAAVANVAELAASATVARTSVCPTCSRAFDFPGGQEGRQQAIDKHEESKRVLNEISAKLQVAEDAHSKAHATWANMSGQVSQLREFRKDQEDRLDAIGDVAFDVDAYTKLAADYNEYIQYTHNKNKADAALGTFTHAVSDAQSAYDHAVGRQYVSDEKRVAAETCLTNHRELTERHRLMSASIAEVTAQSRIRKESLVGYKKEQEDRNQAAKVRQLFTDAREVLHRENLPKLVMQKMLHGLNALLDRYLAIFETNFTAYVDENFDFMCSFSHKSNVPARALSGGQKVALSLAFKFAISELLANQLPVISLDEPTVWLDEINKPRLAEVLNKVREFTERGVFVLVATHESILFPCCSRLYDVGEQTK